MRKVELAEDQVYHVYNRAVDGRTVFMDHRDYRRFLHYLLILNDSERSGGHIERALAHGQGLALTINGRDERELFVEIVSFCLMPNHFHIMLRQRGEDGITQFMHKIGTAYTMYFNMKYNRTGSLFQGPFQAIRLDREPYFQHLPRYIHLNPVDLIEPHWKQNGIRNWKRVSQFLREYPWSSYRHYLGLEDMSAILRGEGKISESPQDYEAFMRSWATRDLRAINDLILE